MKMTNAKGGKTRKFLAIVAMLACVLAVLASGTLAYFTAEETAYNVITTGCLFMELVEETTGGEPWPEEGITGVMPAAAVDKVVYVKNVGAVPFFTRICMDKIITAAEGVEAELNFDHITLDIDTEHWIEHEGFYYYYRVLQPGEQTEPLFTKVSFGPELGNEYMNAQVDIYVLAQAVQSANNGDDPLAALGWSELAKTVIEMVEEAEASEPATLEAE